MDTNQKFIRVRWKFMKKGIILFTLLTAAFLFSGCELAKELISPSEVSDDITAIDLNFSDGVIIIEIEKKYKVENTGVKIYKNLGDQHNADFVFEEAILGIDLSGYSITVANLYALLSWHAWWVIAYLVALQEGEAFRCTAKLG